MLGNDWDREVSSEKTDEWYDIGAANMGRVNRHALEYEKSSRKAQEVGTGASKVLGSDPLAM